MRTKKMGSGGRNLISAVAMLIFSQALQAHHLITVLPRSDRENQTPISFMRSHYIVYAAAGTSPSGPPTSAFVPTQLRHAYGFDQVKNEGHGQIIGIVDAYDDANIESDLGVFDRQFALAACTSGNGCFRKADSDWRRPAANANWSLEVSRAL